jgi:hypothetical protein
MEDVTFVLISVSFQLFNNFILFLPLVLFSISLFSFLKNFK